MPPEGESKRPERDLGGFVVKGKSLACGWPVPGPVPHYGNVEIQSWVGASFPRRRESRQLVDWVPDFRGAADGTPAFAGVTVRNAHGDPHPSLKDYTET